MQTSDNGIKEYQGSLDKKLVNTGFLGGTVQRISSRARETYNNNVRYFKAAGRIALISGIVIAVEQTILRPDTQSTLISPTYASGRQDLFPYPEYNSGWVDISRGSRITLRHNLGGNVNDYFVDMQFRNILETRYEFGERRITSSERHNMSIGGDYKSGGGCEGAWWYDLTSNIIRVKRGSNDPWVEQVRIRIWK